MDPQKIQKVMADFGVTERSAINIVYMLDWIKENENSLQQLYDDFKKDTESNDMPFSEFCYGMWPQCKTNYINSKKQTK